MSPIFSYEISLLLDEDYSVLILKVEDFLNAIYLTVGKNGRACSYKKNYEEKVGFRKESLNVVFILRYL